MSTSLPATVHIDQAAVLKAVNLNASDPKAQALLLICDRYGLDPLLKHVVLIQGSIYVTRDGLLAVAHRSGQLDGIVVDEQGSDQTHHFAKVSVYRKDMRHPFSYVGRYPKGGGNKAYGPEMAVKCAEVMALRRAFNVSLCAREEMWDQDHEPAPRRQPEPDVVDAVVESISRGLPAPRPDDGLYRAWLLTEAESHGVDAQKLHNHLGHKLCPLCSATEKAAMLRDLFATDEGRTRLTGEVDAYVAKLRQPAAVAADAEIDADPDMPSVE